MTFQAEKLKQILPRDPREGKRSCHTCRGDTKKLKKGKISLDVGVVGVESRLACIKEHNFIQPSCC